MTTAASDPPDPTATPWLRAAVPGTSSKADRALGHGAAALATALDALRRRHPGRPLRVWCAGAGGFAEPFTVVMLAMAAGVDVDVIATDDDARALADIGAFAIPGRLLGLPRTVTAGRLAGDASGHRPLPAVRARIRAAHGHVREVPAGGPFDLVVCRDVLHHFRPDVAHRSHRQLLAATDPQGLVVLTAVDALAAGHPLSGDEDVIVGHDGTWSPGVSVESFVDDGDAAPALRLAALLDEGTPLSRRAARTLRLAQEVPSLEEARVAAAALALADGQRPLARQLLEAPLSLAWEGDASTILGVAALQEGALHNARALLGRAWPTSWLAAYLMGALLRRLQREGDAAAHFRLAIALLDGHGTAPAGAAFLPGCGADEARRVATAALRSRAATWHGP